MEFNKYCFFLCWGSWVPLLFAIWSACFQNPEVLVYLLTSGSTKRNLKILEAILRCFCFEQNRHNTLTAGCVLLDNRLQQENFSKSKTPRAFAVDVLKSLPFVTCLTCKNASAWIPDYPTLRRNRFQFKSFQVDKWGSRTFS